MTQGTKKRGRPESGVREKIKQLKAAGYGDRFIREFLYYESMSQTISMPLNALVDKEYIFWGIPARTWNKHTAKLEQYFFKESRRTKARIRKALYDLGKNAYKRRSAQNSGTAPTESHE